MFRLALGPCSCRHRPVRSELATVCQEVLRRLKQLEEASFEELSARPNFESIDIVVGGKTITYNTYRDTAQDGAILIVVQGWYPTWHWPTFISFQVVGHMVADGFVKRADGESEPAPDELLWPFR